MSVPHIGGARPPPGAAAGALAAGTIERRPFLNGESRHGLRCGGATKCSRGGCAPAAFSASIVITSPVSLLGRQLAIELNHVRVTHAFAAKNIKRRANGQINSASPRARDFLQVGQ